MVAVPTFGWPANGSSIAGVKIRTWAVFAGSAGGITKVVSGVLNSRAIACIASVVRSWPPVTTASGLPPNAVSVNTSTVS